MKFLLICLAGALQLAPVMSVPALGIKLPTIDSEVEQGQDLSELIANVSKTVNSLIGLKLTYLTILPRTARYLLTTLIFELIYNLLIQHT